MRGGEGVGEGGVVSRHVGGGTFQPLWLGNGDRGKDSPEGYCSL